MSGGFWTTLDTRTNEIFFRDVPRTFQLPVLNTTAYSAYRAINNFRSEIVDGTWGLGAAPTDELIQSAVQKTGAFCQNLSGLDGNIVVATKSFFNALDSFYSLDLIISKAFDCVDRIIIEPGFCFFRISVEFINKRLRRVEVADLV